MRKLATIREIAEIKPIPDADRIEVARIDGWEVVVSKKDNFHVGDRVVYVEIDSKMPETPEYEFLKSRKYVVKTIVMRGQVSQENFMGRETRMDRSSIGTRMKSYEDAQKTYLTRRMPVMIRVDGNAFHTFTRGFERPFDSIMAESMQRTMKYMCENISGCVLGYTQSDEITLLLIDYKKKNQGAWFGYVKRKVETIAASMATMAFNEAFSDVITEKISEDIMKVQNDEETEKVKDYYFKYVKKCGRAMFDARAFNIPEFEVVNEFIWRQQDCTRNSIQSVGHANFSDKKMHKKNMSQIQDMLMLKKGINWNDFPTFLKRGSCCIKEDYFIPENELPENHRNNLSPRTLDPEEDEYGVWRSRWVIDKEIPIFTQNKNYVNDLFLNKH